MVREVRTRPHNGSYALTASNVPTPSSVLRLALMAWLVAWPAEARAQFAGFGGAVAEADMLYMAGEPELALQRLQEHLAVDSDDYAALWRATRSAVVLAIEAEHHLDQNAWLDPGIGYAERAIELRPDGIDGIYWRGVAAGRRAMNAGAGYAVELAEVVYDDAHSILAVDSLHGGAHNMLGKLNFEVMSLSRVKRLIARTFMGNDALDDTSWENAEYHLHRAADLWPDLVLFHFDLGQLYEKRDRRELAAREMAHVLTLPAVHPTDRRIQSQARALLQEWEVDAETLDGSVEDHEPEPPAPEDRRSPAPETRSAPASPS